MKFITQISILLISLFLYSCTSNQIQTDAGKTHKELVFEQEWNRQIEEHKLPFYSLEHPASWTYSKDNIINEYNSGYIDGWKFMNTTNVLFSGTGNSEKKMKTEIENLKKDSKYAKYSEGFLAGCDIHRKIWDEALKKANQNK